MSSLLQVTELRFLDRGPFTFAVSQGECLGIHGASGVGKSQLFRALVDLIPATGTVRCEGRLREAMSAPEWRKQVTMLPAEPVWWGDRVCDHFREGRFCREERDNLARLGLSEELEHWQVSRLSTGERQRLGLLRAIQNRPKVLLLDEPTSALDRANSRRVEEFLASYREREQAAILWVSHDPEQLLRVAARILIMAMDRLESIDPALYKIRFCQ